MTIAKKLQQIAENMNEVSNTGYRHGYQEGRDVGYEEGYTNGEVIGWDDGYNYLIYDTQPSLDEILALQESYIGGGDDAVDR